VVEIPALFLRDIPVASNNQKFAYLPLFYQRGKAIMAI
jgi:hypothetical protein